MAAERAAYWHSVIAFSHLHSYGKGQVNDLIAEGKQASMDANCLSNLFVLLPVTILHISQSKEVRYGMAVKLSGLDDLRFDQYATDSITNVNSVVQCSLLCLGVSTCSTFSYNANSMECRLHNMAALFESDGVDELGWKTYAFGENGCAVHKGFINDRSSKLCVHFSADRYDMLQARSYCEELGGTLLLLQTSTKRNNLIRLMSDLSPITSSWTDGYIGLVLIGGKTWEWLDGSIFSDDGFYWRSGQPYCSNGSGCPCVTTLRHWGWKMNDVDCSELHYAFCEYTTG